MNPLATAPGAHAGWVVVKFGGTSVSTRPRWDTICRIARDWHARGKRVLIVVSALSGITDKLKAIAEAGGDRPRRESLRAEIVARHEAMFAELGLTERGPLQYWLDRLGALAVDARAETGELPWQAETLALGEQLSSTLGQAYLTAQGLATRWLDAREYLLAQAMPNQNAWGCYLSASVPTAPDPALAARLAAQAEVFISQGFMARNAAGETVILGRGGSDTSAAYFGALLKADKVEIWTDVAGMFSANPRIVPAARLLSRLDYEEAQEIATTGAKVLHPRCLNPVREAQVPLAVRDTNRPELAGTEIGTTVAAAAPSVKAVSERRGITLISMESIGMWQQVGFLADVFERFKRHGLSIDLIGSAETNVTVSLDPSENLVNSDVLSALAADLAEVCRVKVIAPCTAVTLVGRGMRSLLPRLAGVLAEFDLLRVHLVSQSSNNLNLTIVVDEAAADGLVPTLHAALVKSEALRAEDPAVFGPAWSELYATAATGRETPWWQRRRDDLLALAAQATPRYVYDLATVRERARRLRALAAPDRWFYALKANSRPELLQAIAEAGFGLECVSPAELELAATLVPPERLLFTPNFAPQAEYAAAFARGARVTLDNLHPLQHWGETFRGREIILRVDLGAGRGHHDKVRTGGAGSKFGLSLDQIEEFRQLARRHDVAVVGLHAHLGSGILDAQHWREVYAQLAALAQRFTRIEAINIGGGLGVPARADEAPLDLAALDICLAEIKQAYPQFELWLEPGRYLVAEAGVLLARVTQTKRKGDYCYVGVDTGMNSLIRPALYEAWHEIVNLTSLDEAADTLYQVVGPICESGDVLGSNRRLPECREGDVILIAQAGAYGATMASRYNLREPAAECVI
ncbi:MAG: diaminopimelate decarboxylase [Lysobacterales bacterium 69-70]|nr:bifunctional aspartate kinase/diaminopimelate decarboxylase [Xanthomonadaceae bacterium]ODU34536.1 MAG: diaminopimelate decarboxylase [Xanthomonadaceae bacterium SCN 69-320]ODV19532.1 MAG: diaminopimelate decarboxylase [Xanthomonadaceae bacterium SCN 69-25]OJY94742.1 MAG: diaminopimelate decarboxylase [Xanthomonadales bacterium 69-70]